ncbi:ABC transporter ATP-binding protein [Shinella yambaruensis]|uniref:ABC transporter ATP-binding protein n=1 Tax=Shinella yambaruensis TaxID=415996 RepID=UPI003D7BB9BB
MSDPVLSVRDLTTSFRGPQGWTPVVKGLSFDLKPRETLAIVGESGSGKSVTALSLLKLVPEANGRVEGSALLGGRDLVSLPEAEMCRIRGNEIAMIFQEPMTSLNPVLTVGDQISEALILHRGMDRAAARAEALRILDRVRIPAARERLDEYPHRFSGGMRQRVMIAMALACRPKVLIADEPTTALDVTVQAQILDLIHSLQDEFAMGVVFITHDMGVVAEIADRVLVMLRGDKVEEGETTQIFDRPAHAYTRRLLAAVPTLGSMRGEAAPKKMPDFVEGDESASPAAAPDRSPACHDEPLLEVEGLTTRFEMRSGLLRRVSGRVHAVENVSFSLARGETLSLVGESGCGKSTTGRSILRLVEPLAGSVRFEGREAIGMGGAQLKALRRDMQMIFQDPYASLNPRIPVGRAIAEPIVVHGLAGRREAEERAAGLLEKVGLEPGMAARLPHEFSGGQRQRVCIARALALSPKLIVADEAVSALDVSIKAQVLNLMLDLQSSLGLSYLFISHDMATVERVSHRIAVMYLGEIVEIGPRAAIIENPQHAYTRKLLSAVPLPDPARRGTRPPLPAEDLPSPVRAPDFVPPERIWRTVSQGHLVQESS